jgi:signal transduction histidine kinase
MGIENRIRGYDLGADLAELTNMLKRWSNKMTNEERKRMDELLKLVDEQVLQLNKREGMILALIEAMNGLLNHMDEDIQKLPRIVFLKKTLTEVRKLLS